MPNIEIKAFCHDLEKARRVAREVATEYLGLDHQVDTYFNVPRGRLKFRESSLSGGRLIPYLRSDQSGPKKSDYALLQAEDSAVAKRLLSEMLGVETVVEKDRDIYLVRNVRVHLDDVKGKGTFIEFEAVYKDPASEPEEYAKVRALIEKFGISPSDLIQGSYREMKK